MLSLAVHTGAHSGAQSILVIDRKLYACVGSARAMRRGEQERKDDGVLGTDCNVVGVVSNVLYLIMCSYDAPQAGLSTH